MSWSSTLLTPENNANSVSLLPTFTWNKTGQSGSAMVAIDIGTGIANPYTRQQILSDGNFWNQINPGTFVESDTDQIISDAKDITGASTGISIKPYDFADRLDSGLTLVQENSEIPNAVASTAGQIYYGGNGYIEFSGLTAGKQYDFYIYGGKSSNYSSNYSVIESGNESNSITIDAKNTLPPANVTDLQKITCTAGSDGKILLNFHPIDIVILNAIYMEEVSSGSSEPSSTITISDSSDLSNVIETSTLATELTYTMQNSLAELTQYYWGVSLDGGSTYDTIWSFETLTNNPLTAPTINSPADGATGVALSTNLSYSPTDGASLFNIELSINADFTGTEGVDLWTFNGVNATSQAVTLSYSTTYYWRVQSSDGATYVSPWASASFTTLDGPPQSPTLSLPENNATGVSLTNTFVWLNGGGAQTYDLYVDIDSNFPSGPVATDLTETSFDSSSLNLSNSTGYYWKVVAKNASGSAESDTWTFVTAAGDVPTPPSLKTPVNSSTNIYVKPTYKWDVSDGALSYDLEVADNNGFTNSTLVSGISTNTYTPDSYLKTGKVYYWRVRASNNNGTGDWSSVSSFTTQYTQSATVPQIQSPADSTTNVALSPTFTWNAGSVSASSGTNYGAFPEESTRSVQNVVITLQGPASYFNVNKAVLKYNKRFAASYSGDDSMQADMDSFASNIRDGGAGYTDGCGNLIPFGLDFANYCTNTQSFDFHTEDDTYSSQWYSWSQMAEAYQWGSGIFSHGYQDPIGWGGSIRYDVLKSKSEIYKNLMARPGFEEGVINGVDEQYFCAPDSNEGYYPSVIDPINNYYPFKAFLSETTSAPFVGAPNGIDVSNVSSSADIRSIYRNFSGDAAWMENAKTLSVNGSAYWILYGGHGVSSSVIGYANAYGASGTDEILFASAQEILDYIDTRETVVVSSDFDAQTNNQVITLTFDTSATPGDLRFYGLTLLIDTDAQISSININGGITTGFRKNAYKINGTNALINLHWNGKDYMTREQIAQRWVDWCVSNGIDQYSASIAQDYIDCVPPGDTRTNLLSTLSLTDSGWDPGTVNPNAGYNYNPENLPLKYELQIAKASSPNSPVVDEKDIVNTSYTLPTELSVHTDYVWRVKVLNEIYESSFSSDASFSTIYGPADVPAIVSPTDGATTTSQTPSLNFTGTGLVSSYEVQLSTDASFTNLLLDNTNATSPVSSPTLEPVTTYYWRVRATNIYGTSNWATASFTTPTLPGPDAPTYKSPENSSINIPVSGQVFVWNEGVSTDSYEIEIRIDNPGQADDNQLVVSQSNITVTSYSIPDNKLDYNKNYKWHVRGVNTNGTGTWGADWKFKTELPPVPGKTILNEPANDAIDVSISPKLTWNATQYATAYLVEIATDSTNFDTTIIRSISDIEDLQVSISPDNGGFLEYKTKYYWRATASNISGEGTPSTIFSFTTIDSPTSLKYSSEESNASILLENSSTNMIHYPVSFNNDYWNKTGVTILVNKKSPSLNYPLKACKLVEDTSDGVHKISTPITLSLVNNAVSVYVKAQERNRISLWLDSEEKGAFFDLAIGEVYQSSGVLAEIEELGNNWYRCGISLTSTVTNIDVSFYIISDTSWSTYYQGDGVSGLLIYGAQVEANIAPSSLMYYGEEGAAITRQSDYLFGSMPELNSDGGVFYANIASLYNDDLKKTLSISDGSSDNSIQIELSDDNGIRCKVFSNGVQQSSALVKFFGKIEFHKIAIRWDKTSKSHMLSIDGIPIGTNTNVEPPKGLTTVSFDNGVGGNKFFGKCRELAVFNVPLNDLIMKQLTR